MKIINNDEAVSPVIGVILMVAITVILAAVIAAFVFGLAGSTGTAKNVGLTVTIDSDKFVVVTVQGGTDLGGMTNLSYSIDEGQNYLPFQLSSGADPVYPLKVGQVVNSSAVITSGDRVIIKGTFSDGSDQVLVDRTY